MEPFAGLEKRYPPGDFAVFIAIYYSRFNRNRAEVCEACVRRGYALISCVSSRVSHCGEIDFSRKHRTTAFLRMPSVEMSAEGDSAGSEEDATGSPGV